MATNPNHQNPGPWPKLEQGDCFERQNADWLREHLPEYERVWSAFIGHDGCGNSWPIHGLSGQELRERQRFNQAHYSMAKSVWRLWELARELENDLGQVKTIGDLYRKEERMFLFAAYMGHIRDMWQEIGEILHLGGLEPLQRFYSQRNHVIHGTLLPTIIDGDGLLRIPAICKDKAKEGDPGWHTRALWGDVPSSDYVPLCDFFRDTVAEIMEVISGLHGKLYPALMRRYGDRKISQPTPALSRMSGKSDGHPANGGDTIPGGYAGTTQGSGCSSANPEWNCSFDTTIGPQCGSSMNIGSSVFRTGYAPPILNFEHGEPHTKKD